MVASRWVFRWFTPGAISILYCCIRCASANPDVTTLFYLASKRSVAFDHVLECYRALTISAEATAVIRICCCAPLFIYNKLTRGFTQPRYQHFSPSQSQCLSLGKFVTSTRIFTRKPKPIIGNSFDLPKISPMSTLHGCKRGAGIRDTEG